MKPKHQYTIAPCLPENLQGLLKLAYNLRWTWHKNTIDLFRRLDRDLWETTNHNPLHMLGVIKQETLQKALADDGFMAHFDRILQDLDRYLPTRPGMSVPMASRINRRSHIFHWSTGLPSACPSIQEASAFLPPTISNLQAILACRWRE